MIVFLFCFFLLFVVVFFLLLALRGENKGREGGGKTRFKKKKKKLTTFCFFFRLISPPLLSFFLSFSRFLSFSLSFRHWAGGAIGYFPTYVLGAIAAAQLEESARRELSANGVDFDAAVASGKGGFARLREWLRAKVHERGSLPESLDALMVEATG